MIRTPITSGAVSAIFSPIGFLPSSAFSCFLVSIRNPLSINSVTIFEIAVFVTPIALDNSILELHRPVAISFRTVPRFFLFISSLSAFTLSLQLPFQIILLFRFTIFHTTITVFCKKSSQFTNIFFHILTYFFIKGNYIKTASKQNVYSL